VVHRAREYLESLRYRVEQECEKRVGEKPVSEWQRSARREKATTRRLGHLMMSLMQQGNYRDIEAIAFLWDDVFPQHARNSKHWAILCEHFAIALNRQRRYSDVVEKLFTNWLVSVEDEDAEAAKKAVIKQWSVTPATVLALLVACGSLHDADAAIRILRMARAGGVNVNYDDAHFQLLDAIVREDPLDGFETAMQVCDVIVNEFGSHVPLNILPRLIQAAAERGEVQRGMQYYHHPRDAYMSAYAELHFDVCLLTLWDLRCVDEMLWILQHILESTTASADLKERISKGLLRKAVDERKDDCREQAVQVALGVLQLMQIHRIRASNKPFPQLLTMLIEDCHINSVEGFVAFFDKYPNVMAWNSFIVCELLLVAVRRKQVELIDEIVQHALDTKVPIKYVALESVVALYYRMGQFKSVERAADIIRALRKNKNIPLGMALTEIGMVCNIKLERPEEVVLLFEDFVKQDGDRKRVLTRKPMLSAAVKAFVMLKRYDEANAIRQLLELHHKTPELTPAEDEYSDDEDELRDNGADGVPAQVI
jgi:hypothetical protein